MPQVDWNKVPCRVRDPPLEASDASETRDTMDGRCAQ